MNDKIKQFLDEAFKPYGDFPARKDVEQELLTNLIEKYNDLKAEGKTDTEAYKLTTESFGDVSEIMEQVAYHKETDRVDNKPNPDLSIDQKSKDNYSESDSRFRSMALMEADLGDTQLPGSNFSMSALTGTNFNKSDLHDSKFKAAALKGASFFGANLIRSNFDSSDVQNVNFDDANLTEAKLHRCALKGASFTKAVLDKTEFSQADLSNVSFENQTLKGTVFDGSSLNKTTFKGAILENVSFHHSKVKKAIFDGTTMDKVTYALLKGMKAHLDNVLVN